MFVIVRVGMVVVVAVFMIAFHFGFSLVVTLIPFLWLIQAGTGPLLAV
jgi:hypothetical protein